MNSPVSSATGLMAYRGGIVACFVFRREIGRKAAGFFDGIGQTRKSARVNGMFVLPPTADVVGPAAACPGCADIVAKVSCDELGPWAFRYEPPR
jgi:hypothetical protein